jgi:Zn-finger nucleic acid-binding protein
MGGTEPACPACGQSLRAANVSGVSARVCGQCHGTLLAQIDMIRTLEAMSVELLKTFDPDMDLDPVDSKRGVLACPQCQAAMARDDYCGAGLAFFDRCERCRLLWLGADELGTMTLMWARMEKRLERAQQQTRELLDEADQFITGVRLGRAASRVLLRFL